MVAARLNSYLDDNNLHELRQSAYKQGHSTETTLVKVQNDILRSIDERNCVELLLLDLSAAFDTVDHSILLSRLRHRYLELTGKLLNGYTHTLLIAVSSYVLGMDIHLDAIYFMEFRKDLCWDQFYTYYILHALQMLLKSITCLIIFTHFLQ